MARHAEQGDAQPVAESVVSAWKAIDDALSPILGQHGVSLLYQRSLHLTIPGYPWLSGVHQGVQDAMDLVALEQALAQRSSAEAATAGGAFLQAFDNLLVTLIGSSLTERLLHPVWHDLPGDAAAQEIPS
ncbi:hypothetical protein ACFQZQ_13975 [Lysobacter koreensis]|uniref:Uncharacterized protein n=1 Tax=Lysobacter koreensis TaxID=266122 RepID=A0ABW2YPT6_9GAMM